MRQSQVAQALNVSQQAVQAWEVGRRWIQISILPAVAALLSVSLEDLLGDATEKTPRRRGPAPKWQQMIEEIDSLPKAKQKIISEMVSALIA
jgi:transcriptional regulator with XRE-family HTH domain